MARRPRAREGYCNIPFSAILGYTVLAVPINVLEWHRNDECSERIMREFGEVVSQIEKGNDVQMVVDESEHKPSPPAPPIDRTSLSAVGAAPTTAKTTKTTSSTATAAPGVDVAGRDGMFKNSDIASKRKLKISRAHEYLFRNPAARATLAANSLAPEALEYGSGGGNGGVGNGSDTLCGDTADRTQAVPSLFDQAWNHESISRYDSMKTVLASRVLILNDAIAVKMLHDYSDSYDDSEDNSDEHDDEEEDAQHASNHQECAGNEGIHEGRSLFSARNKQTEKGFDAETPSEKVEGGSGTTSQRVTHELGVTSIAQARIPNLNQEHHQWLGRLCLQHLFSLRAFYQALLTEIWSLESLVWLTKR